jgi:aspartate racemase
VVAVSQYTRDYVREWAHCDAVTLPISFFAPPAAVDPAASREFVTLVNPCAVKGLSIFQGLAERFPEVAFAAVPSWGTTTEDLAALRRAPNVTLLPPTDQPDDFYKRSRVLLAPSLCGEARSRVIVEALGRGIPVLASDVGGNREAMLGLDYVLPVRPIPAYQASLDEQSVPVAEVPEQDLGPWEAALHQLLTDPDHYQMLSNESRRRASDFLRGWNVEPFEALLQEVSQRAGSSRKSTPAPALPSVTPTLPAGEMVIHRRFERQAAETPGHVAVQYEGGELTYAELDRRANRLAGLLKRSGVTRGAVVAIYLDRSPEFLVAILAVLKTGAAYLPLAPDYPDAWISQVLRDAAPSLVIHSQERKLTPGQARTLLIEEAREGPDVRESADVGGDDVAYVMYTSGSTGIPKAACLTHGNVCSYVAGINEHLQVDSRDRYLHTASFSFSSSVRQWAVPLLHGATLRLAASEQCADPLRLLELIEEDGVTVWDTLAPVWRAAALALEDRAPAVREALLRSRLRLVTFSGGPLAWDDVLLLRPAFHVAPQLLNICGNTESIGGTVFALPEAPGSGRVPIGRPLAGVRIDLVGADLQPVSDGDTGEIVISGATLGQGYLNRPDLNREKFVELPGVGRAYRTGDLARWRADGELECLGRVDEQVKIRGFRVELTGVEAVLNRHPGVREAAVVAVRSARGEFQLAAQVVPLRQGGVTTEEVRSFVRGQLPAYMVPSAVSLVEELPRTRSGKLDRPRLAEFAEARRQPPRDFVASGGVQQTVTEIWEDVLKVRPIGPSDDFFALGGHSLLSVVVLERVRRRLDKDLPLSLFLQAPTVAGMVEAMAGGQRSSQLQCLVRLQEGGSRSPFFCVHGIGGGVLNYRHLARRLDADRPFYGLQAPALGGDEHQYEDLPEMAARYLREVRTVQAHGPYFLGGQSFGGKVAYEMARQLQQQGEEVALLALFDTRGRGYPQYRPAPVRLACHLWNTAKLPPAEKVDYVRVRGQAVLEAVRRPLMLRLYQRSASAGSLPRVLSDIGYAHSIASANYNWGGYRGRVALFRAAEQPVGCYPDPYCGWKQLVEGELEVYEIPGTHLTIVEEPHVAELADRLREALARADAD